MADDLTDYILKGKSFRPMFWATVGAATLPTLFGLVGLYFCFVPTEIGRSLYNDYFLTLPIALCFTIGTPLVAWCSCISLEGDVVDEDVKRFRLLSVGLVAVKYSFIVHGLAFLIHVTIFSILMGGDRLEIFSLSLFFGGIINAALFVLVTMPLSVFCSAIFCWLYSVKEIPGP